MARMMDASQQQHTTTALTWKQQKQHQQHNNSTALVPSREQKKKIAAGGSRHKSTTNNGGGNGNDGKQQQQQHNNVMNVDKAGRVLIKHNKRWSEYPKITQALLDQVLQGMATRNAGDLARKTATRAAILDVLNNAHLSIVSAARNHQLGLTSMRRYCHDAKVRLEAFLGEHFVNDAFLRQFDKYKERVTLDHYMEALRRAEKQVPADLNGPKKPQKRSSGPIMKRGSPKQASKRVSAHRGANNAVNKGQASSSSSSSNVHDGADQQQQKQVVLSMVKPPSQIPPLLTSRAPIERLELRGTPAELRETIQTFFTSRYQGNPAELANPLSKFLVNEARMRRELANSSGSIDEIGRAYNMLASVYDMENVKVLEEEDGKEHEEMSQ